jgi:hypothetical protein
MLIKLNKNLPRIPTTRIKTDRRDFHHGVPSSCDCKHDDLAPEMQHRVPPGPHQLHNS